MPKWSLNQNKNSDIGKDLRKYRKVGRLEKIRKIGIGRKILRSRSGQVDDTDEVTDLITDMVFLIILTGEAQAPRLSSFWGRYAS